MIRWIALSFETIATLGTISSVFYYLASLWSASQFHGEQIRAEQVRAEGQTKPAVSVPSVSILKPLKGADPEMLGGLRSHCVQDYPEYEILFGVSDSSDPALALVEQLKAEFPQREIRVAFCQRVLGTNLKVSNLAQMLPHARHEYLVVNDSDIHVNAQYLRSVIALLANDSIGLVTCLYRGVAAATLGSRLESLGISTDFAAGVLTARYLENGICFGMGSTLAFRRESLDSIGGFQSLVDYLADDYQLGNKLSAAGKTIKLSGTVVQTSLPAYSFRDFWEHQIRWARTIRDSRPSGYVGLIFTFGLVWSILMLILAHGARWALALFFVTVALRVVQAVTVGRLCLKDHQVMPLLWLLPLRDLIAVGIWIASFFGNTIRWRGELFYLKKGKLIRVSGVEPGP